jgi:2-(3-amino-3-carboxypropyl)histidine synthase
MKRLFLELRRKFKDEDISFNVLDSLPGKSVSLSATIQYLNLVPSVKKYLESRGKKVITHKGAFYNCHVIGCNPTAMSQKADTILLLSDGKFHAINNAVFIKKEIYIFNTKTLEKISQEEINLKLNEIGARRMKFLHSTKIGIIVSTKPGQKFGAAKTLKKQLAKKNKQAFIFQTDNINLMELENFPDIEIWINTACPGLCFDDKRIVNLRDIQEFL